MQPVVDSPANQIPVWVNLLTQNAELGISGRAGCAECLIGTEFKTSRFLDLFELDSRMQTQDLHAARLLVIA